MRFLPVQILSWMILNLVTYGRKGHAKASTNHSQTFNLKNENQFYNAGLAFKYYSSNLLTYMRLKNCRQERNKVTVDVLAHHHPLMVSVAGKQRHHQPLCFNDLVINKNNSCLQHIVVIRRTKSSI